MMRIIKNKFFCFHVTRSRKGSFFWKIQNDNLFPRSKVNKSLVVVVNLSWQHVYEILCKSLEQQIFFPILFKKCENQQMPLFSSK